MGGGLRLLPTAERAIVLSGALGVLLEGTTQLPSDRPNVPPNMDRTLLFEVCLGSRLPLGSWNKKCAWTHNYMKWLPFWLFLGYVGM